MTGNGASITLWTEVANDPSYRPFHRAVAVHELFKRHVGKPVPLKQIALLLAGGCWLVDAAVEKIESMGGEIPLRIPVGGAAFVVRLPEDSAAANPKFAIYLALGRALDPNVLRDALMSMATDPSVGETRIMDFALFPESLAATSIK
jgi:hypothetical protein